MGKKTQAERVLEYIKRFGSITTLEAFRDLGVTRLSARIFELRNKGLNIDSTSVTSKNRYGETCTYAKYFLKGE
ncbi:MAG TPA: helix-turn-helix domain-containing protein [Candidatus Coprosoma intestinipullorum]|uniref:Helix-turn-helix domain-containing protein n=1 Tax=Candidatus Coprosoma intestinipullorum TaxID=2840752 RepID=A0A9D1CZ21_9FIRM|nr:helix-turn-helix domain-containing protein [Candidatus Coprosoma intestinipullorum]